MYQFSNVIAKLIQSLGLKTEQRCDKWPVNKCSIEQAVVRKFTPETKCEKIARELCAPDKCGYREVS